jgi:hypothetical protein
MWPGGLARSMENVMPKHRRPGRCPPPMPMVTSRRAHAARLRFLHKLWAEVQIDTPAESRARDSVARREPSRADVKLRTA